ncbi:MAG: DUF4136 domain-containing protein [Vicinamibacterales bacterium]
MFAPTLKLRLIGAAFVAAALAGCASMTVRSYTERGAQFPHYTTYIWGTPDELTTGDPRLDNNPFFRDRVRADVDRLLAERGFKKVMAAPADLIVHYHASFHDRIDVNGIDREYGYCEDVDSCRPYIAEAGTLTIDLVDAKAKRLAWRGWAEGTVDGMVENQAYMEKKVDDAVTRIVENIPRR